ALLVLRGAPGHAAQDRPGAERARAGDRGAGDGSRPRPALAHAGRRDGVSPGPARPLRVLAVSDFYLPRAGGVERVVHETARGLRARGVEVEVLTRRLGPGNAAGESIDGVRVERI